LRTLLGMELELARPFIVVAVRQDGIVRVRLRHLNEDDDPSA